MFRSALISNPHKVSAFNCLVVRPILPAERCDWDALMAKHHYLGFKSLVGPSMRYVAHLHGRWVALLGWAAAALKCTARDAWIGWPQALQWQRLHLIANNSRFLIFPWVRVKNLASHVLGQLWGRIRADWDERWGYSPVLMESFVDPRYYDGTCYKGANWEYLGMTTGEGLVRPGKSYRTSPKKIFVRALVRDFRELLCSDRLAGEVEP